MIEVFFNHPANKWVARIGGLPMHLGGKPGDYDPAIPPRLLTGDDSKIMLFDTERDAWDAAASVPQEIL